MSRTITPTMILIPDISVPEGKGFRLSVSAIIPVGNGANLILKCLSSLRRQYLPKERYKIISGKCKIRGEASGGSDIVNGLFVVGG